MPQFSLKALVLGVSLFSIGAGLLAMAWRMEHRGPVQNSIHLALIVGGCFCTGVGLAYPFGKSWIGAFAGFCLIVYIVIVGSQ